MNAIYDSIIYGFLVIDGVFFILAVWWIRRKGFVWLLGFSAALFLFAWLIIFYGSFIEPRLLVVREQTIHVRENPTETLRAVLVSDFHLGPYKKEDFVERVVSKINEQRPDVIFIAGDFVYDDISQIQYLDPIKNLKAPLGVFAVLGNHDYGEGGPGMVLEKDKGRSNVIREKLESLGVRVLVNDARVITKDGEKILLIGSDDVWTGRDKIHRAARIFLHTTLVLSHNPDIIWKAEKSGIDLVLAGHTHGGQIRLPGIGPVPNIPDELGRAYDRGLFQFGNTQLFITSGLGEMGPRARLLVPPEIVVLKIKL